RRGDSDRPPIVVPLAMVEEGGVADLAVGGQARYAFWIGDENLKARPLGSGKEGAEDPIPERNSRQMLLQRAVNMDGFLVAGAEPGVIENVLDQVRVRGQAALIE